ncbi:MAG TPA: ATP-dependent DNA ligase [Actinomycetota bacterium]|nr:ATP-dependent DNA ligase [Actinomycetota bacterium]
MAILVDPMLARLSPELPHDGFVYEPKWDGFRCVVARDGTDVRMVSRHRRPFTRYFPELVEAFLGLRDDDVTLDGEIVIETADGFDFAALLSRLHPAESRVLRLAAEIPARFVAFDVVWRGGRDLRAEPFRDRRAELLEVTADAPAGITPTPQTQDAAIAVSWLAAPDGAGIDGVLAKDPDARYQPGKRAMVKVKTRRTLDAVVAGYRWMNDRQAIGSLLLGLYDDAGALRHIGVASSFTEEARERFLRELSPSAIPLDEHPWAEGFLIEPSPLGRLKGAAGRWTPDMEMDWVPIRLDRVCEVGYDRFDGDRLRHPARFLRWRPDRDPTSCTLDQINEVERG